MWCHVQHTELEEDAGRWGDHCVWSDIIWLQKALLYVMDPFLPRDGWAPAWPCEVVNEFLISICLYVASVYLLNLPLKLCSCQTMCFLTFAFLILSPMLLVREWVSSCMWLIYQLRVNYNSCGMNKSSKLYMIIFCSLILIAYDFNIYHKTHFCLITSLFSVLIKWMKFQ